MVCDTKRKRAPLYVARISRPPDRRHPARTVTSAGSGALPMRRRGLNVHTAEIVKINLPEFPADRKFASAFLEFGRQIDRLQNRGRLRSEITQWELVSDMLLANTPAREASIASMRKP